MVHTRLVRIFGASRGSAAWLVAALVCVAGGCATQQKTAKKVYYFYPPPPNEPRLQFLTAFSSERDLRGGEEKSLMTFLTGARPSPKDLGKPYGAAAGNKKIYVCDTDLNAVLIADLQTRRIGVLAAQGEGALKLPLNVALDADGTCYVADAGRDQVVIFDQSQNCLGALGKLGEMKPRDVAVSKDRIYVADLMKHSVRVFDKSTRNPLFDVPRPEERTNQTRALFTPTNLALDSQGRLYVGDTGAFRVQVYDAEGKYLRSVGGMGDRPGQFARVKGVAVDRANRLYAADAMSQVVQVFDEEGRPLTWFGEPESAGAIQSLPTKVLVDYEDMGFFQSYAAPGFKIEHLVIVINQLGPHKVSIYGFGEKK